MQIAQWGCQASKNVDMLNFLFCSSTFVLIGYTLQNSGIFVFQLTIPRFFAMLYCIVQISQLTSRHYYYYYYYFIVVFIKGVYDYSCEAKPASKVYNVAGILWLPFMVHVMICPMTDFVLERFPRCVQVAS
jgi:hypothetical protein